MLDFAVYKNDFKDKIKWCNEQLKTLNDKFIVNQKHVSKIQEYKRDCHILCRQIDLLFSKFTDPKAIPPKLAQDLEQRMLLTRFNKFEQLTNYLRS